MKSPALWLVAAAAVVAGLLMLAPEDLFQGDQEKQVGYVMDILHGGKLSVQYEVNGRIATKPPLYNWCAAAACLATRSTAPWVMKLPGLLAGVGALVLVFLLTRRFFGPESALWATLAALAAHHLQKLMWFARTDMLLTFTVLLAIQISVAWRSRWWRSLAVGAVLGASFLTKGPVGPGLYAVWLVLWGWRQGSLRDRRQWLALLPGLAVFALMAGAWVAAVWQDPQFQHTVIRGELGDRLTTTTRRAKPFWYYVPLLFGRIAPWPLAAIAAVVLAYRRRDPRWRDVLFIVLWFAAFFVFFSAVPAKRHDLLLPAYPPVFMLAGLGLGYLVTAGPRRWTTGVICALALSAAAGAVVTLVRNRPGPQMLAGAALTASAAVGALWLLRRDLRAALASSILAVALFIAIEGWAESSETRAYARLREFVEPLRTAAHEGRVFIWEAHPLLSYELGLHQRGLDVAALLHERRATPAWLAAGKPIPEAAQEAAAVRLVPAGRLVVKGQGVDVTLFRMEPGEGTP